MKKVIFYCALLFCLPTTTFAEYWSCKMPRTKSPVYTNTPVVGEGDLCTPLSLERSPYNKVPSEMFARFHLKETQPLKEKDSEIRSDLQNQVETSLKYREITSSKKKGVLCDVSGEARGPEHVPAMITVTRGMVTKDSVRVNLRKGFKPVSWKMSLKGACREPEVRIKNLS